MASSTRESFRWKKEAVEALLDCLIDLDDERLRGANITPTQIWETAAARTTKAQGSTIHARATKSKRDMMKREYKIWTQILAQPGFARDENGDLLASDTLWDAYLQVQNHLVDILRIVLTRFLLFTQAHPEAKKFRHSQIEFEEKLDELFPNESNGTETRNIIARPHVGSYDDDEEECEKDLEMLNTEMSGIEEPFVDELEAESRLKKRVSEDESHLKKRTRHSTSASTRVPTTQSNVLLNNPKMVDIISFTESLDDLVADMKSSIEILEKFSAEQKTPTERAVELLFTEFNDLTADDQVKVSLALEDDTKARIFLMGTPEFRRSWATHTVNNLEPRNVL